MDRGKVGDEREQGLQDLQLYVDALTHAVTHRADDDRHSRE